MDRFVLSFVDFSLHEAEIHGLFDDLGIVEEPEFLPIDWLSEWLCGFLLAREK